MAETFFTSKEAEKIIGISERGLRRWREQGKGPEVS